MASSIVEKVLGNTERERREADKFSNLRFNSKIFQHYS